MRHKPIQVVDESGEKDPTAGSNFAIFKHQGFWVQLSLPHHWEKNGEEGVKNLKPGATDVLALQGEYYICDSKF